MLFWGVLILTIVAFVVDVFIIGAKCKSVEKEAVAARAAYHRNHDSSKESALWRKQEAACERSYKVNQYSIVSRVIFVFLVIILAIMLLIIIINYITAPYDEMRMLTKYETYIHQLEYTEYVNEVGDTLGNNEYWKNISEYNYKVRSRRRMSTSFWVGPFVPNFWQDIPLIATP